MAAAGGAGAGAGAVPRYNFVISAHGNLLRGLRLYPIPQNFSIHTPSLEKILVCDRKIQTKICTGSALESANHYNGPRNYKRYVWVNPNEEDNRKFCIDFDLEFTPDLSDPRSPDFFKSGLVICKTSPHHAVFENTVVHEITERITLRELLPTIQSYLEHYLGHTGADKYNYDVQLTVLACTSTANTTREVYAKAVPLGSSRRMRKMSNRRNRHNRRNTRKTRKMRK